MYRIKNHIDRGLFEALGDYDNYIQPNTTKMICSETEELPWLFGPKGEIIEFFNPNVRIGFRK